MMQPTYICSFASPCVVATAGANSAVPCVPSTTVIRPPRSTSLPTPGPNSSLSVMSSVEVTSPRTSRPRTYPFHVGQPRSQPAVFTSSSYGEARSGPDSRVPRSEVTVPRACRPKTCSYHIDQPQSLTTSSYGTGIETRSTGTGLIPTPGLDSRVPSSDVTVPRACKLRTCSYHIDQPPTVSSFSSSVESQHPGYDIAPAPSSDVHFASQLIAGLPPDVVKSLLQMVSSRQNPNPSLDALNVTLNDGAEPTHVDPIHELSHGSGSLLASTIEALLDSSSKFEAKTLGRWSSQPGLTDPLQARTAPFSTCSQSAGNLPGCPKNIGRSLGELGLVQTRRFDGQLSSLDWYVCCWNTLRLRKLTIKSHC